MWVERPSSLRCICTLLESLGRLKAIEVARAELGKRKSVDGDKKRARRRVSVFRGYSRVVGLTSIMIVDGNCFIA